MLKEGREPTFEDEEKMISTTLEKGGGERLRRSGTGKKRLFTGKKNLTKRVGAIQLGKKESLGRGKGGDRRTDFGKKSGKREKTPAPLSVPGKKKSSEEGKRKNSLLTGEGGRKGADSKSLNVGRERTILIEGKNFSREMEKECNRIVQEEGGEAGEKSPVKTKEGVVGEERSLRKKGKMVRVRKDCGPYSLPWGGGRR